MKNQTVTKLNSDCYPIEERKLLSEHNEMFRRWKETLQHSDDVNIRNGAQWMTNDGFYPFYTSQKIKILYLGRDSYGMLGCDYLDTFYNVYRSVKKIGEKGKEKSLNQHQFHARLLHVTWGILNGMTEWDMIPWAETIGDNFGTQNGISYAFANLGKTRFQEEGTNADLKSIEAFCKASTKDHNFIAEQISLLKPDVIISMNLGKWLDWIGPRKLLEESSNAESYILEVPDHQCLLVNTWHFSARKEQKTKIYKPICDALMKWNIERP